MENEKRITLRFWLEQPGGYKSATYQGNNTRVKSGLGRKMSSVLYMVILILHQTSKWRRLIRS